MFCAGSVAESETAESPRFLDSTSGPLSTPFSLSSRLKRCQSEFSLRTLSSQDFRRGSREVEEAAPPRLPAAWDLERRSSGWKEVEAALAAEEGEGVSRPERRSRRHKAQKPVTGSDGWRWQVEGRRGLGVMARGAQSTLGSC